MSEVKSYAVGNGDMFYINHNSDNFTLIDCCLRDWNRKAVLNEIKPLASKKKIRRFISTHPDDDHIAGIEDYESEIGIENFYVVKNSAIKDDPTDSFDKYCELRDGKKAYYIYKGCKRLWMNESNEERGSSGIDILWPVIENEAFKEELALVAEGGNPNNICPIISYSVENSAKFVWMGDLETEYMERIQQKVTLPKTDVFFAPHHGRESGTVPASWLGELQPKIVVIGEAPSEHLNYYDDYNTLTQNSAGDMLFDLEAKQVHIYTENDYDPGFLDYIPGKAWPGMFYCGTLKL